ncbi:AAA family ATPase [Fredinandcohnia humi]
MKSITTLHLMIGLPCSGKTTIAKQLEHTYSALRLTPDEWHTRLFGHDVNEQEHVVRHNTIESLLWDVATRVLELGVDVILDFGFWVRSQRDEKRMKAAELGVNCIIHFVYAPEKVLLSRLQIRNATLPKGVAYIPESKLKDWYLLFEQPHTEELEYTKTYIL